MADVELVLGSRFLGVKSSLFRGNISLGRSNRKSPADARDFLDLFRFFIGIYEETQRD